MSTLKHLHSSKTLEGNLEPMAAFVVFISRIEKSLGWRLYLRVLKESLQQKTGVVQNLWCGIELSF